MGKARSNRRISSRNSSKDKPKRGEAQSSGTSVRSGLGRDVGAVALLALATGSALALATYSSYDGALVAHGMPPANLCGPVGHRVASFVYEVLGLSAAVVPFALGAAAWRLFRGGSARPALVPAAAYVALILSVAALSHLALAGSLALPFPAGGGLGRSLAGFSVRLFSTWGSAILVTATALVALVVATGLRPQTIGNGMVAAGTFVAGFLHRRLSDAVDEHRAAVAELRAEEDAERSARRAAERLAEQARIAADGDDSRAEAKAVAGALALEQVRRASFDDPAWVDGLEAATPSLEVGAELAADGARGDEAGADAATLEVAAEDPPRRRRRQKEPGDKILEVPATAAAVEEPVVPAVLPAPPGRPEIIVSQAMLDRAGKKKRDKDKKEAPAFAFTKAGDVFQLPSTDLLPANEDKALELDTKGLTATAQKIVETLKEHDIDGTIRSIRPGPVVTLYEFLPVSGVKLSRIENLDKELTMALSATRIRIIAPIPGKGVVGIEVPNATRVKVWLRDIFESESFGQAGGFLPLGLGKDIEGVTYCVDLQRMPHLLIAGTTGSGKSVGLNTMILSMLFRQTPAEVRMIMVDPKMTELSIYEDIPHLLLPVVTDPAKASRALQWAVDEMERRTQILADSGSRDLKAYNAKAEKLRAEGRTFEDKDLSTPPKKLVVVDVAASEATVEVDAAARLADEAGDGGTGAEGPRPEPVVATPEFEDPTAPPPEDPIAARDEKRLPQKLPYIVVVIDELADLMMTAARDVEISLARLAQKARATGIHLIVATQRPSTDVVTGMVKNNFPARITFRLASRHDSQTIINGPGAESLLGDGDMLVMTATQPLTRVQGAFVDEPEVHRIVEFLKKQGRPVYDDSILRAREGGSGSSGLDGEDDDPTYDQAIDLVSHMEEVSVSKLQREMKLGYNKAAKIVERMEREGIVGPANGVKPRKVLIRPVGEEHPHVNV